MTAFAKPANLLRAFLCASTSIMLLASHEAFADPHSGPDAGGHGPQGAPHAAFQGGAGHGGPQNPGSHPAARPQQPHPEERLVPPSHNDHRHRPDTVVNIGNSPHDYSHADPHRVPAPVGYHHYRRNYPYFYSSYYTQRLIPVEASAPYVEVQCGDQPITGTIVDGVAGGLIGNQFGHGGNRAAVTVGGALLGAIIGQSIDRQDESCAYQALEYAQPNTQVGWVNPNDNYAYTVTPGPVTQSSDGRYCREYQAKILVGNSMQDGYGQACRQPDGSWQVEN
jgi:surface antigen